MSDTKYNASHALDPTAYKAIKEADHQPQKISDTVKIIKDLLAILDLELVGRIEIKDKKTGRKWK